MERNSGRVPSGSSESISANAGRKPPVKSHIVAADRNGGGLTVRDVDDSAFLVLLWLLAAAAVLPGALDLPFLRGAVPTASQLNSLVGRATLAALSLFAALTLVRVAGTRPTPVFGALASMWGLLLAVSWIVGDRDVTLVRSLLLLLVAITLSLCKVRLPRLLWHARLILRVYLVLCVVSVLVMPEYAWSSPTGRQWLGVPQFVGVALHPNALGPIAALALLLELGSRGRRYLRWIFGALALTVLVLAQSRGGWLGGVLGLSIFLLVPEGRISARRALMIIQGVIGAALVVLFVMSDVDSEDITNGRLGLWTAIIDRSAQSWLLGNGIDAFSAANRFDYGFAVWAGQGHNQVLDTFFTGGLLGVALMLVLVVLCAVWALRTGPQRRIAVAAFAILFVDMVVESPLRPALSATGLMSVIVLAIISAHGERWSEVGSISKLAPSADLRREW
ncbi:MAG: exopolysaccharide production protein ExoQ [Actinomycetota bacterium]|nr:exopolysaccharide production protein ExoQ [Actinomycetota bacterium]